MTPQWQYIVHSSGRAELFGLLNDPEEKDDLIGNLSLGVVREQLQTELDAQIGSSVLPWHAMEYLAPLNRSGQTFAEWLSKQTTPLPFLGAGIGAVQAYFSHQQPYQLRRPNRSERNVLRSLPYD
jgi:hypothetical protein